MSCSLKVCGDFLDCHGGPDEDSDWYNVGHLRQYFSYFHVSANTPVEVVSLISDDRVRSSFSVDMLTDIKQPLYEHLDPSIKNSTAMSSTTDPTTSGNSREMIS